MTTQQAETVHTRLRCSDSERERTAARVHEAVGEGRLTMDEAEERLDQVYRARYRDELAALDADLPTPSAPPSGWSVVWAAVSAQLLVEAAILAGRIPTPLARRAVALLVLLGPVLLLLGGTTLLLHAALGWHEGPGLGPDGHRVFTR